MLPRLPASGSRHLSRCQKSRSLHPQMNKFPSAPARCVFAVTDVFDATVMDVSASVAGAAMSSGSAAPDKGSEPLSIEFKGLCGVPGFTHFRRVGGIEIGTAVFKGVADS